MYPKRSCVDEKRNEKADNKSLNSFTSRLQNNARARIYTQKCIKLQYVGCVECELVFVYTQAVLFSICCRVETRSDLRTELKGIQRR